MAIKKHNKKNKFKTKLPSHQLSIVADKKKFVEKDPNELPNTFKFAAESLKHMSERGGSAGSIIVNKYKSYNYKLIFALVMNTLKSIKIIKKIIHNLKLASSAPENNIFLLEILVGDLLYGQGLKSIEKNPIAAFLIARKNAIKDEQTTLSKEFAPTSETDLAKYLRVNHMKSDMIHVISQLKTVGLTQLEYAKDKIKFKKFVNKYKTMDDNHFMLDFHFPADLIILKPAAADKIKRTDLFKKNKVTLQDKASFMAVEALEVEPSQKIIDACFAPGCKTSLIATKMKNKGKILAYDIDKRRFIQAIHFLKLNGATCVKTEVQDFSKVKLARLLKVHGIQHFDSILIDPSCSGSGIKSRVDYRKTDEEPGRLKKLQAFQVALLRHALRARVSKSIVYCTCSTSIEENEQVVEMALNESGAKDKWEIVEVLPYWPGRGESDFEFGSKCLRSDAAHLTNGFFIAKFKCNDLFVPPEQDLDDADGKLRKKPRKMQVDEQPSDDENLDQDVVSNTRSAVVKKEENEESDEMEASDSDFDGSDEEEEIEEEEEDEEDEEEDGDSDD